MSSEGNNISHDILQQSACCQPQGEPMCVSEDEESPVKQCGINEGASECRTSSPHSGKGVPISELRHGYGRWGPPPLPPVHPSSSHTVLIKLPWEQGQSPEAYPATPCDKWDQEHVRMPNSSESLYPVQEVDNEKGLRLRWELVQEALLRNIVSSHQLESAILSYNSRYNERWNFRALHSLFDEVMAKEETEMFFEKVLPQMIRLALQLPELVTGPIPLLRKHKCHTITLSQLQIGSILANAFFCTFPRRNSTKRGSEYAAYPDINFNRLFQSGDSDSNSVFEKLKCILNYFRRICSSAPQGVVTFSRRYLSSGSFPDWSKSNKSMPKFHITSSGYIEDEGSGMLQVDFANKYIGGGVLGWGCVQEEIRFVICPELIVSRLFTECLDSTEALIIVGCERFNSYRGYGHTFEWAGDFRDTTPYDSAGRRHCSIVAMDALYFTNPSSQYSTSNIAREVNKAFVGFHEREDSDGNSLASVATGNWGCGAFRGDAHLKALLQLMAAAEAGRSVFYFTFGDQNLCKCVYGMYKFLVDNNITVGMLWNLLYKYGRKVSSVGASSYQDLYEFLQSSIQEAADEKELKPATPVKRFFPSRGSTTNPKPSTSTVFSGSSRTDVNNTQLSQKDLDTLIEEFDSDTDMAEESQTVETRKKSEASLKPDSNEKTNVERISSSSCLSLIEESLKEDPPVKRVNSFRKESRTMGHSSSEPSSKSDLRSPAKLVSHETSSSSSLDMKDLSVNEKAHPASVIEMDLSTPVDRKPTESSITSSSSKSLKRSTAPKRKISDYFNPS